MNPFHCQTYLAALATGRWANAPLNQELQAPRCWCEHSGARPGRDFHIWE